MIDLLLTMPTMLGAVTFMALTTFVGLAVYFLSFRCVAYNRTEDQLKEVKEATGNLFRVVGWLISLFLSPTFADVYRELIAIENASEAEAAAIMDTHDNVLWSVYARLIGKSSIPRSTAKRTTRDTPMNEKPTTLE